ncbi:Transposon, En/Spm-like protein [Corchorus capsularis]|uniref:Transposon, En/Spm-like protein n=1 Tax=Corchorus capsularis TaxID=210143 RepID=A0A1R3J562_COCAP|nr:Transposon, En/Spm-like protein [Corchorus capsularis]
MDKSWMQKDRCDPVYEAGLEQFLDFAFEGYSEFSFHGEDLPTRNSSMLAISSMDSSSLGGDVARDDVRGLLRDALNMHDRPSCHESDQVGSDANVGDLNEDTRDEEPTIEATNFYKLLESMNEPLYPESQVSKLSFSIKLLHLKCLSSMMGKALDLVLELLRNVFPFAAIPTSLYELKKIIGDLGFSYKKIHSCPQDCMLYWGDRADQESCHVCGSSRWLQPNSCDSLNREDVVANKGKLRPAKVLRYLDFASEPRNVRLGLASDGFNPFKTMSSTYSTWPVVIIPYNQAVATFYQTFIREALFGRLPLDWLGEGDKDGAGKDELDVAVFGFRFSIGIMLSHLFRLEKAWRVLIDLCEDHFGNWGRFRDQFSNLPGLQYSVQDFCDFGGLYCGVHISSIPNLNLVVLVLKLKFKESSMTFIHKIFPFELSKVIKFAPFRDCAVDKLLVYL